MEAKIERSGICLALITLAGFALRLFSLDAKGLWYDEACSVAMARNDLNPYTFFNILAYKPLYFLWLKGWTGLFGAGEFWVRFPSAFFGAAAIPVLYFLGKEISGKRTGLWAAFLLAISCFHIYHSQQARHFTLMTLAVSLSFLFLVRAVRDHDPRMRLWNTALNIALIFLHPYGLLVLFVQHLFILGRERSAWKKEWLVPQAVTLAAVCAWFLAANKPQMFHNTWWIPASGPAELFETFQTFAFGGPRYGLDDFRIPFELPWALHLLSAIHAACFLTGLCVLFRRSPDGTDPFRRLVALWMFLPPAAAWAVSLAHPVYLIKHLMISLPAYCLIVAAGLAALKPRVVPLAAGALMFVLNLYPLAVLYGEDRNIRWREGAAFVKKHAGDNDAILISTASELAPFLYHFGGRDGEALRHFDTDRYGWIVDGKFFDSFYEKKNLIAGIAQNQGEGAAFVEKDFADQLKLVRAQDRGDVWLLVSRWTGEAEKNAMLARMAEGYQLVRFHQTGGLDLFQFRSVRPRIAGKKDA